MACPVSPQTSAVPIFNAPSVVRARKDSTSRASRSAKHGGFIIHTGKLEIANVEDAAKQAWHRATEELTAKPKPKPPKGKQVRR